jgi:hypothetical protein
MMITAYGDADTKRKALENGAEPLFTRPTSGRYEARLTCGSSGLHGPAKCCLAQIKPNRRNSSSTLRWNEILRGTMDVARSHVRLALLST